MNKHLAALIAAAIATSNVYADDIAGPYVGVTVASHGKIRATSRTGAPTDSVHTVGGRVYAGYRVNHNLALEAGYGDFGTDTLKNTGTGASGDARIETTVYYAAAKGIYQASDKLDLFGKLGVAHTRFETSGLGQGDTSINRALLGVGAEYSITPRVGLTLEFTRYGNTRPTPTTRLGLHRFEAGVSLRF